MNHTLERIAKFFWLWDVLLKSLLECIDYPTYGATWLDPGGLKVFLDRSDGRKEVFVNDLFVSFVLPLQRAGLSKLQSRACFLQGTLGRRVSCNTARLSSTGWPRSP